MTSRAGPPGEFSSATPDPQKALFGLVLFLLAVLVQGNWTQEDRHVDHRIGQVGDRDRARITRCTRAYESQV
jgi:hypothetical protein